MTDDIYMIDEANKLHRKGEHIGDLDGEKLTLKPDAKKYQAAVTRWLREQADQQESDDTKPEAPVSRKLTAAEQEEADNKGIASEALEAAKKAREAHRDDVAFARSNKCPEPPKKNPQFGDKTPAYVDWLQKYRPSVFATRYGVKGKGKVPVIEEDSDGVAQVVGYRDADMATRKTHLTEKVETQQGLTEDMSWDA